ncbi:sulfurtransferase [Paucisalibacillus sp. EB02]|uniref:sulfurtransferase n=1 Tax=Paucisalibacillus sp. EB02 TaxID=1347087 RepID=UPI0004AFBC4E|nr:sulfurtransferase [Paucisalibacillus sp. EB02]
MSYLISIEECVEKLLSGNPEMVIVDARFQLNNPEAGREAYNESHLPGAVYFDLEEDLSNTPGEHGGNHPLPDVDVFAEKLGRAGIDQDTTVIVYDNGNDMFAPRFWWNLYYMGHNHVYILEGGFEAWIKAGHSVTNEVPHKKAKTFIPSPRSGEIVDIDRIRENIHSKTATLIDSRGYDRYLGKTEPLYKKAGHIPGAKNYFWMNILDENGNWKRKEELEKHFAKLDKTKEIIVSCGSGVSATPNVIALKIAGFSNVKLYPGSFSDWISYEENEVETKDETND